LVENGYLSAEDTKTIKEHSGTIYYFNLWKGDTMIFDVREKYKLFEI
jgi:hypothetical protein